MKVWFRTGEREVPEYIAARFAGIETRHLTYEQAMAEANKREMANYLNREQNRVIKGHFEKVRSWES